METDKFKKTFQILIFQILQYGNREIKLPRINVGFFYLYVLDRLVRLNLHKTNSLRRAVCESRIERVMLEREEKNLHELKGASNLQNIFLDSDILRRQNMYKRHKRVIDTARTDIAYVCPVSSTLELAWLLPQSFE